MNVQPTRPGPAVAAYTRGEQHTPAHGRGTGRAPATHAGRDEQQTARTSTPADVDDRQSQPAQGVLRLLQEGHFKGVADVRLRINFNDELRALGQEQYRADLNGRASALTEAFASLADARLPEEFQTEEAAETFATALRTFEADAHAAIGDISKAEKPDPDALKQALQAAFTRLSSSVKDAFAPASQATTEGTTETPAADSEKEEEPIYPPEIPSELAVFMNEMAQVFSDAMDDLAALPSYEDRLPVLSVPEGQGKAYEKFISEYNRLRSGTAAPEVERVNFQV